MHPTDELLQFIYAKNRCIDRFYSVSLEFLDFLELREEVAGTENDDLTKIDFFQQQRETAIKAMELYDRRISESIQEISTETHTVEFRQRVQAALDYKDKLLPLILDLDLKLISKMEKIKQGIHQSLLDSRKNKSVIRRFKSAWIKEPGEELDTKL